MPGKRRLSVFIIIFFLLANSGAVALAGEDDEASRATLGGIWSIYVRVAPIDPEIEGEGLTAKQINRNVEKQLRGAGIKLLSEKEYRTLKRDRSYPLARLEIIPKIVKIEDSSRMIYSVTVRVSQLLLLARKHTTQLLAPTWQRHTIGYSSDLVAIRDTVRDMVDEFINDYISANPK